MNVNLDTVSLALVNATSGLSLGLSTAIIADVLPWKWTDRRPWLVTLIMVAAWVPLELVGGQTPRRFNNAGVDVYLCVLFLLYIGRRRRQRERAARRTDQLDDEDDDPHDGRARRDGMSRRAPVRSGQDWQVPA